MLLGYCPALLGLGIAGLVCPQKSDLHKTPSFCPMPHLIFQPTQTSLCSSDGQCAHTHNPSSLPPLAPSPTTDFIISLLFLPPSYMPFLSPHLPDSFLGSAVRMGREISIFLGSTWWKGTVGRVDIFTKWKVMDFHYESPKWSTRFTLCDVLIWNAIWWQSFLGKTSLQNKIQTAKLYSCFIWAHCCVWIWPLEFGPQCWKHKGIQGDHLLHSKEGSGEAAEFQKVTLRCLWPVPGTGLKLPYVYALCFDEIFAIFTLYSEFLLGQEEVY